MTIMFLFVEITALILFCLGLVESARKGPGRFLEFFMIFIYGLLLETLDMRIFKTYHYGPEFRIWLGHVPVAIAWLWAMILSSSMAISDSWGLPAAIRPFADALLAVLIDLSIDAIAIRVGFWGWTIPLTEGWFGVPAGNLYAWMWVAFFYSFWARAVRLREDRNKTWRWAYLILPFLSYAGLFLAMVSLGWIGKVLGFTSHSQRLWIFWAQFLIFAAVVAAGFAFKTKSDEKIAPIWFWGRLAVQVYFLFAFFYFGMFRAIPILGVIAILLLAGEFAFKRLSCK